MKSNITSRMIIKLQKKKDFIKITTTKSENFYQNSKKGAFNQNYKKKEHFVKITKKGAFIKMEVCLVVFESFGHPADLTVGHSSQVDRKT